MQSSCETRTMKLTRCHRCSKTAHGGQKVRFSLRRRPHLSVTRVDRSCRSPGSKSWDTFRPSLPQAFRNTLTLSCRSKWHRRCFVRLLCSLGLEDYWRLSAFLSLTESYCGGSSSPFNITQNLGDNILVYRFPIWFLWPIFLSKPDADVNTRPCIKLIT